MPRKTVSLPRQNAPRLNRKFGGKGFTSATVHRSKTKAKAVAAAHRVIGRNARVVRTAEGFRVFWRPAV